MASVWKSLLGMGRMSDEAFANERDAILQRTPIPVFWLFGKTGSGKTSVIRYLTGAQTAEIGNGFRPQTKHSSQYDFPTSGNRLLRFLDTRGLGEIRYDPRDDIGAFNESTHVMIVTARVMDHALNEVVNPLRVIRKSNPDRPVLLALTCLHEAYPGDQHPLPDPFCEASIPGRINLELRKCLELQAERFEDLVDVIVPIDLTRPEEGFEEPNFGGERLRDALLKLLPAAYRLALLTVEETIQSLSDLNERRGMPYVLSFSTMAATAAAVPTPWVDIPIVLAIQSRLVQKLASIYGQDVDARLIAKASSALAGRVVSRLLLRGPLKAVPILGLTANAALAFAYTYALGRACCWYFGEICRGSVPTEAELKQVWSDQLAAAATAWKNRDGRAEGD